MDEGLQALVSMRYARRYNQWILKQIQEDLGNLILEAGSGIGNLTAMLLNRELVVAVDNNAQYIEMVRAGFADNPNVRAEHIDLTDREACAKLEADELDTVPCVNVLEHIEGDTEALGTFQQILTPGGRLVLLVPNCRWLYGTMDRSLGHVRRYSRRELTDKLERAGFVVERMHSFNGAASLPWFVNGRLLKRGAVPGNQVKLFDMVVGLARLVDPVLPLPGLSLIAVARKPIQACKAGADD
jgi:SAM-dependent methyltransferase